MCNFFDLSGDEPETFVSVLLPPMIAYQSASRAINPF